MAQATADSLERGRKRGPVVADTEDREAAFERIWQEQFVKPFNKKYPTLPLYGTESAKFYVRRAVRFLLTNSVDGPFKSEQSIMSNETTTESRICQRGVDGSAGCGHEDAPKMRVNGLCQIVVDVADHLGEPPIPVRCGHVCDFSPPPLEAEVTANEAAVTQLLDPFGVVCSHGLAHNDPSRAEAESWYICGDCGYPRAASTVSSPSNFMCRKCFSTNGILPDANSEICGDENWGTICRRPKGHEGFHNEAAPAEVETHEFVKPLAWQPQPPECCTRCNQHRDAPVHKVESGPDIECQFCSFKGTFAEGRKHRKDTQHLLRTPAVANQRRAEAESSPPAVEPPARVYLRQLVDDGFIEREWSNEPSPASYHNSIEYAHLAPIRAALANCWNSGKTANTQGDLLVRKSDWDALVKSVKGES